MESLPVFQTTGNVQSFILSPFNYYKEDPSGTSRDALDIENDPGPTTHLLKQNSTEYINIRNHGITKSFKCSTEYHVTDENMLTEN